MSDFESDSLVISPVLKSVSVHRDLAPVLGAHLSHPNNSYLFYGPPGSGKELWALAFAAGLLCSSGGCGSCGICLATLARRSPDLNYFEKFKSSLSVDTIRDDIIRLAVLSPNQSSRRVVIIEEFDNIAEVAPVLLKVIEEPPASTVFIIVARTIHKALATIASRCVRVEFSGLLDQEVTQWLEDQGLGSKEAKLTSSFARGNLDLARDLGLDGRLENRLEAWGEPAGKRYTNAKELILDASRVTNLIDSVTADLKKQQEIELSSFKATNQKSSGMKGIFREVENEHKRILRFRRKVEFDAGISIFLAYYRGSQFFEGADPVQAAENYQKVVDASRTTLRQLNAGVSETIALASLFGQRR
ncbi:hypothetical protein [Acidithrix sp. C25]|uniref:hypothetical protein n=1 Tax=Acidithrix sp. C25 TaxID=1671482 RepID=UPI00191BAA45|nr:hypothetical protein [Acidithrix sp. C25]CAG4917554.1 unnamed protein product [Acidithrix sp. C25]